MTSYLDSSQEDFWLEHALREVSGSFNHKVYPKWKTLHKFGENPLVGTSEATLMTLPAGALRETYVSSNLITQVSSSSGSDTGIVGIEGHTIDGSGNLSFRIQFVTLNGQSAVSLATPLARATRVYNTTATNWAGNIYIAETDTLTAGVPDTDTKVHLIGPQAENQSLKAATSLSSSDYAFVTSIYGSVNKKTAAGAVIRLRLRSSGGVFRTLYKLGVNSIGPPLNFQFRPYLVVSPNSDIEITAEADGASTAVAAGFNSILCSFT